MDWRQTVRDWLEANERSSAWLARRARMNETYLYSLLSGAKSPGDKVLGRLEAAMDLTVGRLIEMRNADREEAGR